MQIIHITKIGINYVMQIICITKFHTHSFDHIQFHTAIPKFKYMLTVRLVLFR